MASAAQSAVTYATRYIGVKEHPAGSNHGGPIDGWAAGVNMGPTGDIPYGPWCGAFVHAVLKAMGVKGLSSRMRYCPFIVQDAKAGVNGLAHLVAWDDMQPGDLVVFQWDTGPVDHVGMVQARVSSSMLRTVEGNTAVGNNSNGGEVMQRTRNRVNVAAIVRPKYPTVTPVPLTPCEWPGITLKNGSKGAAVKVVQGWINTLKDAGYDYNHLEVDGSYGDATEHGVRNYQGKHKLDVDGVVGPLTWRALCGSVRAAA